MRLIHAACALVALAVGLVHPSPAVAQCDHWQPGLGFPGFDGSIERAVVWDPDGPGPAPDKLVVMGSFLTTPDGPAPGLAMWDGGTWQALPEITGYATDLAVYQNRLYISIWNAWVWPWPPARPAVFVWNSGGWTPMTGANAPVESAGQMTVFDNRLVLMQSTPSWDNGKIRFLVFDGTSWEFAYPGSSLPRPTIRYLGERVLAGSSLYAIGSGQGGTNSLVRWNGTAWDQLPTDKTPSGVAEWNNQIVYSSSPYFDNSPPSSVRVVSPVTDSPLGNAQAGVTNLVNLDGTLYALGLFSPQAGAPQTGVARFDGTAWQTMGTMASEVYGLIRFRGELYAYGAVGDTGGGLARWDGSNWTPVGLGLNESVQAIAFYKGRLYIGGTFTVAGGQRIRGVAQWDGTRWQPLGSGVDGDVLTLFVDPEFGDRNPLYVGGRFQTAGGLNSPWLAAWDGLQWSAVPAGLDGEVLAVANLGGQPGAGLVAAGRFQSSSANGRDYVKILRNVWAPLGTGFSGPVRVLAQTYDGIFAGGEFLEADGQPANYVAFCRSGMSNWIAVGEGFNKPVTSFAIARQGSSYRSAFDLYAGGFFTRSGVTPMSRVAKWNGTSWQPLGPGVDYAVYSLAWYHGDLIAGGYFQNAGTQPVSNIARYDGAAWRAMGGGLDNEVSALLATGTDLYAGGDFLSTSRGPSAFFATWTERGRPWFTSPLWNYQRTSGQPLTLKAGQSLTLSAGYVYDAGQTPTLPYQWYRDGVPLLNGTASGGGFVTGAAGGAAPNQALTLRIDGVSGADAGTYSVRVFGPCGTGVKSDAVVIVTPGCVGDLTVDGVVDDEDFVLFARAYDAYRCQSPPGSCWADLNNDRYVDDDDFVLFAQAYELGACP